ncbi:MAG: alkaline shock response membrane anchor protein AmaP [Firmicutes bacterium]|jgi:uncharacterized alkaline shock family protein YloU|nr:alkaline shock response membrane anchor protein AmaP [Bacillota bacterium]
MTTLDRVFLGLTVVILVVFAGSIAWTIGGSSAVIAWLQSPGAALDGGIVVLLILLMAIYLTIMATRQETQKSVVYQGELGEVRISINSIQGLVAQAAREIPGVNDVSVTVTDSESLRVRLDIQVLPGHHIPQLSEELQKTVKDYLDSTVGISVAEVQVFVRGIISEAKARLV